MRLMEQSEWSLIILGNASVSQTHLYSDPPLSLVCLVELDGERTADEDGVGTTGVSVSTQRLVHSLGADVRIQLHVPAVSCLPRC